MSLPRKRTTYRYTKEEEDSLALIMQEEKTDGINETLTKLVLGYLSMKTKLSISDSVIAEKNNRIAELTNLLDTITSSQNRIKESMHDYLKLKSSL